MSNPVVCHNIYGSLVDGTAVPVIFPPFATPTIYMIQKAGPDHLCPCLFSYLFFLYTIIILLPANKIQKITLPAAPT